MFLLNCNDEDFPGNIHFDNKKKINELTRLFIVASTRAKIQTFYYAQIDPEQKTPYQKISRFLGGKSLYNSRLYTMERGRLLLSDNYRHYSITKTLSQPFYDTLDDLVLHVLDARQIQTLFEKKLIERFPITTETIHPPAVTSKIQS